MFPFHFFVFFYDFLYFGFLIVIARTSFLSLIIPYVHVSCLYFVTSSPHCIVILFLFPSLRFCSISALIVVVAVVAVVAVVVVVVVVVVAAVFISHVNISFSTTSPVTL